MRWRGTAGGGQSRPPAHRNSAPWPESQCGPASCRGWTPLLCLPGRHGDEHREGLGLALMAPMPFPAYLPPPRAPLQPNLPEPLSLNLACVPTSTLLRPPSSWEHTCQAPPPRSPPCITLTSWPGPLPPSNGHCLLWGCHSPAISSPFPGILCTAPLTSLYFTGVSSPHLSCPWGSQPHVGTAPWCQLPTHRHLSPS